MLGSTTLQSYSGAALKKTFQDHSGTNNLQKSYKTFQPSQLSRKGLQ